MDPNEPAFVDRSTPPTPSLRGGIPDHQRSTNVAWLALDAEQNEPARFLLSLCAALEPFVPEAVTRACALLQSTPAAALQPALRQLLVGLGALSHGVALVLDDYHWIEARAVHDLVTVLLEYLPPRLFLILITRSDPTLSFARLRSRGQLIEIRAADLRFTDSEAAAFLNECRGVGLPPAAVVGLNRRVEGWIAALQAAASLLQGEADPAGLLEAFTGGHRYVVDHLFEHALRCQPPAVQQFLGRTAWLDRLCDALCETVTGMPDAGVILQRLASARLFLTPLEQEAGWYRFNPLFAGVLRAWSLSRTNLQMCPKTHAASVRQRQTRDRTQRSQEVSDGLRRRVEQTARPAPRDGHGAAS
jgi:LuxR family maltose regulon positive regulatory protein